jgi:putative phage-type endonuclease
MNRINLIRCIEKYIKFVKFHNINLLSDIEMILMEEIKNNNLIEKELEFLKGVLNKIINDEEYKINDDGELLSSIEKCVIIKEYTDEEFEKIKNNYEIIRKIKSPPQRSKLWFKMRENVISASDGGCALGLNKYEPQYKFIYKKVFGSDFKTNKACYWGKCFEDAVVLSYEFINDCIVEDFGLLPNEKYKYISASPDGIVYPYKKDGSMSNIPSRMLEIKCVVSRTLNFTGNIYDNMCPSYYWVQTQLQMQTTNVNECDFAQYKIEEFDCKDDFIKDNYMDCDYISNTTNLEKSLLIEVIPNNLGDDDYIEGYIKNQTIYDKTKHFYPPKINLTLYEMEEWEKEFKTKLENLEIFDEIEDEEGNITDIIYYKYHNTKYYRIMEKNCTLIVKDDKWFEEKIPVFESVWNNVLFLRQNPKKAIEWKNYVDSMNRKNNALIIKKLEELTNIEIFKN